MDKHVLHNIIHRDAGNNSKDCPVCNGDISLSDKSAMTKAANDILARQQSRGMMYEEKPAKKTMPDGGGDLDHGSGEEWADEDQPGLKAGELSTKKRNNLADSDFAYIDKDGGRHLPIADANHVRNALARFNQTHFDSDEDKKKAMSKILAKAKEFGIKADPDKDGDDDASDKGDTDHDKGMGMQELTMQPLIDLLSFAEKNTADGVPSRIKIIPVGKYKMQRYGDVNITKQAIQEMADHFNQNVRAFSSEVGLPIDIEHGTTQYKDAAAGWIKKIHVFDDGGYADVEWTKIGKQLLKEKIYKFYSPEFHFDYLDPQHSFKLKNVMTGGGLVNKPMIKDDLRPLVNGEEVDEKNLTKTKNAVTLLLELTNSSHKTMQLSEILAKAKADRTSDEQAFVVAHKDELTLGEARKEGFIKEELPAGTVVMSETEAKTLREQANAGFQAAEKLRKAEIVAEIKKVTFDEKEGVAKIATDQVEKWADKMMKMSEDDQKDTLAMLGALPGKVVFKEEGTKHEATGSAAAGDLDAKVKKFMEDNKVDYATALSKVVAENPQLYSEYSANLPVAQQER